MLLLCLPNNSILYTDGPDTTQVVIFARPVDDTNDARTLNLIVARLATRPLPALRPPRPDDPTPRKPPLIHFGAGKRELKRVESVGPKLPGRELKRAASSSNLAANAKRKKVSNGNGDGPASAARSERKKDDVLFKVPDVPLLVAKSNAKGKGKQLDEDEDVFGDVDMVPMRSGGSGKRNMGEDGMVPGEEVVEMERANKNVCCFSVYQISLLHVNMATNADYQTMYTRPSVQNQGSNYRKSK